MTPHERKLKDLRIARRVAIGVMLLAIPLGILWGMRLNGAI
jgi:hypothetical protein